MLLSPTASLLPSWPNFPGTKQITALQGQEMPLSYSVYPNPCSRRGYASHGTKEFFVPRSMLVPAHLQLVMPAPQPRIASTPHPQTPTEADQEQNARSEQILMMPMYVASMSLTS